MGHTLLLASASAIALSLAAPSPARAQTPTIINVPAQPLADTLLAIGARYDVIVMAPDALVQGKSSPAISGDMSLDTALDRALDGTGLKARRSANGSVVVERVVRTSAANQMVTETIIVQGKFQQSLIDRIPIDPMELPFTLNTVDRDLIDLRNLPRPIDVIVNLPNVSNIVDSRGLGAPAFASRGFVSPVIINNRIQNAFRGGIQRDDSFVERYEVLKGPASIALGPIGGGGIVNTVTKSPEDDPFFGVELSVDQFGSVTGEFDANVGTLLDNNAISFRVSGAYRNFNFDADETEREVFAIRPIIDLNLSERTYAQFAVAYTDVSFNPSTGFPLLNDGSVPENFDTGTFFGYDNGSGDADDVFVEGQLRHEFLDNLRLTVRGSYQKSDGEYQNINGIYNYLYDDGLAGISPNNPIAYTYSRAQQYEEENVFVDVQLSGHFTLWGQRQDVVIGAAYNEASFLRERSPFGDVIIFNIADVNVPRVGPTTFADFSVANQDDSTLYSVFAEMAIRPTDWLSIVGGIRYDDLEVIELFDELVEDDLTVRIGATTQVSESVSAYISYAESFEPQLGLTRNLQSVGPETTGSVEIGVRGNVLEGTLQFSLSAFRSLRRNVAVADPENTPDVFFFATIGEQRNQGIEITADWQPLEGLNINLNYGFLDVEVLEGDDDITPLIFPDNTASAFVTYEVQNGALRGVTVGGGPRYVGQRDSFVDGISFDDFVIWDFVASYPVREDIELSVNILNATDNLYLESAGRFNGRLTGLSQFGAPRTAIFTLRATF